MLLSLHISNYALIDQLDLTLEQGMCVITGETGAGKSIILGALGLLQGNRADAKAIKSGAKKCVVEGTFDITGLAVEELLQTADIDLEDSTIIVRREVTAAGKSRTFINDTPTTLGVLREVSSKLIDIHSQHQNLLLSNEDFLLDTLDSVAGNQALIGEYHAAFQAWHQAEHTLRQLQQTAHQQESDREFWEFQLAQIDEAQLQEEEQAQLEEESKTLEHAEDIKSACYQAVGFLRNDEHDVVQLLRSAKSALEGAARYMGGLDELTERLSSARIELDDVLSEIETKAEEVDFDPERLLWVNDRLSTIYSLEKKHQVSEISELLAIAEDLRQRLSAIDNADARIAAAEAEVKRTFAAVTALGAQLTATRQQAATEMVDNLTQGLQELGMPSVQILFDFTTRPRPDRMGCDAVRFLFTANKQMPLQDVAQTASGGEIARVMLTLKALIAQKRNLPTIIFDEIDTGVSGTMAERMGRVMQRMGKTAQVICITHLGKCTFGCTNKRATPAQLPTSAPSLTRSVCKKSPICSRELPSQMQLWQMLANSSPRVHNNLLTFNARFFTNEIPPSPCAGFPSHAEPSAEAQRCSTSCGARSDLQRKGRYPPHYLWILRISHGRSRSSLRCLPRCYTRCRDRH